MSLMKIIKGIHLVKAGPTPVVPAVKEEALDKQETKRIPTRLIQSLVNNPLTRSRQTLQNFKGTQAYLQDKAKGELVEKTWVPAALVNAVFAGDLNGINLTNSQRGTKYTFTAKQLRDLNNKLVMQSSAR